MTTEPGVHSRFRGWVSTGPETERTAYFSDAVFAIAMTLLAVEIQVPSVPAEDLAHALREQVPEYLAFALSFAVVGAAWMSHHRMFRLLAMYDSTLQRINLVGLLFVALVAYGTAVLAAYADQSVAVILYAAIVAAMGLAHLGMWQYAWNRGLFTDRLGPDLFGYLRARGAVVPAVFLASIPVALVSPDAGKYLWIAIAVFQVALIWVYHRRTSSEVAPPTRRRPMIRKHQLSIFFVLAFLLPWAVWGTTIAQDHGAMSWHIPQALAFWLGLTTATFGTAALAEGWPGVKDLLVRMVRARVGLPWYAAALLLTPALALLAVELGSALGMPTAVGTEVSAGGVPVLLLVSLWLFLLTEESAWRGFALPRLQARMQPVAAALVLGVLWGLWHIPLFLIVDSFQSTIPFAGFLLSVVATSVLTSWIFNNTRGSVLLAALFHATTDVAIAYSGVMSAGTDLFWLMVALQCLAAAAVVPSLRTMPANPTGLIHPEPSAQGAARQTSGASTR